MKVKLINQITILLLSFLFAFCKDNNVGPGEINPDIIKIKDCCNEIVGGNYIMNVWTDNNDIFSVLPPRYIKLNIDLNFSRDSVIKGLYMNDYFNYRFINKSNYGSNILIVFSQFTDVSIGSLYEFDLETFSKVLLKDSSYNISSAVYFKTKPNECVFYSYGNYSKNLKAGYYWLNTITGADSLILPYLSSLGNNAPSESVNGFDISPDDSKLLIPISSPQHTAKAAYFDLKTKMLDTLNFNFPQQFVWFRFNHSGSKFLYNSYPLGIGSHTVNGYTEIGIINVNNLSNHILDLNTNQNGASLSIFPAWSPDDKNIVFGSAPGPTVEPASAVGNYSLYILKNVN